MLSLSAFKKGFADNLLSSPTTTDKSSQSLIAIGVAPDSSKQIEAIFHWLSESRVGTRNGLRSMLSSVGGSTAELNASAQTEIEIHYPIVGTNAQRVPSGSFNRACRRG